jgi:hypothetical protein
MHLFHRTGCNRKFNVRALMFGGHFLIEMASGRSAGYNFFRVVLMLVGLAVIPLLVIVAMSFFVYHEISTEAAYHRSYGPTWKSHYEEDHGSLTKAHTRVAIAAPGTVALIGAYIYAYRQIVPALRGQAVHHGHRRKRRKVLNRG